MFKKWSQPNPSCWTIPRPLFSHCQDGYKYFSFMKLCKEILSSDLSFTQFQKLFFPYGSTVQEEQPHQTWHAFLPYFSLHLSTHFTSLSYIPDFSCFFFYIKVTYFVPVKWTLENMAIVYDNHFQTVNSMIFKNSFSPANWKHWNNLQTSSGAS